MIINMEFRSPIPNPVTFAGVLNELAKYLKDNESPPAPWYDKVFSELTPAALDMIVKLNNLQS